eukprot:CAMPEP_0180294976 /NCGR_PEP_ID=MMETSP0988-20121125/18644_1 /TAXON_ID=697907 /ORGANISM="non described non described, Strain CCMP2293" /LENGTH=124 /DNA_ID=CAMNT_0022272307 /DNA_START=241 /DNA_END=612 /DNA_ORIENTATION=-
MARPSSSFTTGGFVPGGLAANAEPHLWSTGPKTGSLSAGGEALRRSSRPRASPCSSASTSFSLDLFSSVFHFSAVPPGEIRRRVHHQRHEPARNLARDAGDGGVRSHVENVPREPREGVGRRAR